MIVPIYNVEDYLDRCLDSVRSQRHHDLEILVVDDGSPDRSARIAVRHAAEDERIQIITRENGGLGAARNTGIKHATGDYLCFVDSDDVLPANSISSMFDSAEASGSDMVVGAAVRFNSTRRWKPGWVELHAEARIGVSTSDFPEIIRNNYTWNKLYRTSFWHRCGLWFREGVAYEDQPIITQLYIRASGVDVLPTVTYEWRQREDQTSISQQTHTLADLRDRILAWDISHEVLEREAPQQVYDEWQATLWSTHFHWYLKRDSTEDDTYWSELQSAIARLTEHASAAVQSKVPPEVRVPVELVRHDLREEYREFKRQCGYVPANFPARLTDHGLLFELPGYGDVQLDLSDRLFTLDIDQIVLEHRLDRANWTTDGSLVLEGWAYYSLVDLTQHKTSITIIARDDQTGQEWEVETSLNHDRSLRPPAKDRWPDYTPAAFRAELPIRLIVDTPDVKTGDRWSLLVRVRTAGLDRTTPILHTHGGASVRHIPAWRIGDASVLRADTGRSGPFRLEYLKRPVVADRLELSSATIEGRLHAGSAGAVQEVRLVNVETGTAHTHRVEPPRPDPTFAIPFPQVEGEAGELLQTWSLRAKLDAGEVVAVSPATVLTGAKYEVNVGPSAIALGTSRRGDLVVAVSPQSVQVDSVEVTDDVISVSGRTPTVDAGTIRLFLDSVKTRSVPVDARITNGAFSAELPLRHAAWGLGEAILPSQPYTLMYSIESAPGGVTDGVAYVSDALVTRLPLPHDGDVVALTVQRGRAGRFNVSIIPPVGRGCSAAGHLNRLEQEHLARTTAMMENGPLEGLLIETNAGEIAGCSAGAVHQELRRRGSDLPVYWAVRDRSVVVPAGGIPVVRNTPEWFEKLRTAKYLIDNLHQPPYHRKPPGQVIVETFQGYPSQVMGHPYWQQLRRSRKQLLSLDQRTDEWDYLMSPATYATPLLTRDFAYDGAVLEIGCPRNDVLQSTEASDIRRRTRESLGIGDQTVVLYSPTSRDKLADHGATTQDFLGTGALASSLGDAYVVLVRGHAFHTRSKERPQSSPGVFDVTDYPDPAHLYLASDLAVLDYSPVRFDYAVTGKPMLFLVPDLEQYQNTPGWAVDFTATAPGPQLTSTEEVARSILEIDRVTSTFAASYETFRSDFLDLEDGRAAARLVDAVFVPRGDAPAAATSA